MPPKIALALCLCFICVALFYFERRRKVPVSKALFWPTLFYFVTSSRSIGNWMLILGIPLPGGGGGAEEGSFVERYFYLVLSVVGVSILNKRRFDWGAAFRENRWLAAFVGFMFLSVAWSDYNFVSFKRFIKMAGSVIMALVVLTEANPFEAILAVIRRVAYIHLPLSILFVKYFRDLGVSYDWFGTASMWQGISTSKNVLGQLVVVASLCLMLDIQLRWRQCRWKNISLAYLAMAFYLLKGSEGSVSMTSLAVFAFASMVFFRLGMLRNQPQRASAFGKVTILFTASLVILVIIHSVVMFSENTPFGWLITKLGRNITLTDRTIIWNEVYDVVSSSRLMGVGYGGFWIGREANIPWNSTMTWVLGQGHSGYVDTYLQLGWIGIFLMAGTYLHGGWRLLARIGPRFEITRLTLTLFIVTLFVNITETTYLRGDHHLWFLFLITLISIPSRVVYAAPGPRIIVEEIPSPEPPGREPAFERP